MFFNILIKTNCFLTFSIKLIVFTHSGMFPQGSPTLLQASPGSGEKNHLNGLWKTILKKHLGYEKGHNVTSPWPTSNHLVVVIGPQVGLLTGSGVD